MRPPFKSEGIGALAFVPLVSDGRLLGMFTAYYARPRRFAPDYLQTAHSGVDPHPVDLANVCAEALEEFEVAHPEIRIERVLRGDTNGHWDADRLLQVCWNLLGNAVQHGDRGSPVRLCVDGSVPTQVTLEVHNAGVIPAEVRQHLFEPFHREQHRHARSGGLGLGLFIVRELVRAHGGTIEVGSSEEPGTVFRVVLPR